MATEVHREHKIPLFFGAAFQHEDSDVQHVAVHEQLLHKPATVNEEGEYPDQKLSPPHKARDRSRTYNPRFTKPVLCQLSYTSVVETDGVEPTTSGLQSPRSPS